METVRRGASESTVFGLKSTKKSTKVVKKRWCICSGTGGLEFESPHFDQKENRQPLWLSVFLSVWMMRTTFVHCTKEFVVQTKPSKSLLFSGKCRFLPNGCTSTLRPQKHRNYDTKRYRKCGAIFLFKSLDL